MDANGQFLVSTGTCGPKAILGRLNPRMIPTMNPHADRADLHPDHQHPRPAGGLALGRRDLLRGAAALGVAMGIGAAGPMTRVARAADDRPVSGASKGKTKNVIFMVADGMSFGTLMLGDVLTRRSTGKPGAWATMWTRSGVRRALQSTHSLNSPVTDSAAAASTWGSGQKVNNGSVNVRPDGEQLLPICIHAQQRGKAVGVVTTARVTHATPAGFYANVPRRDYEGMIAEQCLERGMDVALGGGARFFAPSLIAKHPGYQLVRTAGELMAARPDGRLLGLFSESHVPYVIDREPSVPSLPMMATTALNRLSTKPEGFVLQIEAGRVDHAAHDNDAAGLVCEQMEFERTIAAVWAWLEKRNIDDTLVVITSDHGNANPGLSVYNDEAEHGLERLLKAKNTFEVLGEKLHEVRGADARLDAMTRLVQEHHGYAITPPERDMLAKVMRDERVMPFAELNKWPSVLGGILANHYGVSFISPNHSADYVEMTAIGPGADLVGDAAIAAGGVIDNVQMHQVMVDAMDLGAGKLRDDMHEKMVPKSMPKSD